MNAIEILALILAVVVLAKMIMLIFSPTGWFDFAKRMTKHTGWMTLIYIVLAAIVGYYLFSTLTVVQVGASVLFASLLMGIAWIPHMKKLLKSKKDFTKDMMSRYWISILIWVLFALWILYALFL